MGKNHLFSVVVAFVVDVFAVASVLLASSSPCLAISLDQALSDYLDRSPQLKAQSTLSELSQGDRWRRFLPKEPQFQYGNADNLSAESYGISLTTSFPGKSFAAMDLDRTKSSADRLELQARRHEAAKLIVKSYLDCASNKALVDLQRTAVDDFSTLARSLKGLYEAGHSTQAEKIGAELQERQARVDLVTAENHADANCKKWLELFGHADAEFLPAGIPDDLTGETLKNLGSETADEARGAAQLATSKATQEFRWWAQAPDLTWTATRNHYLNPAASPAAQEWTTTLSVAFTLPLFFPFTESVEARRAGAQAVLDQSAAQQSLITAKADRQEASQEFERDARRLMELRKQDIPLGEALVESTSAAYRSGKLGYAELILSRKTLLDLKNQEIQMKVALLMARLGCLDACHPTPGRK
ncbi:MAG: hypothetical protein C5B49_07265 [Bdellovibrio sp.]|nr:MAG: hypothetical protein C5B49_07265 [Bdellovibrio sp.]